MLSNEERAPPARFFRVTFLRVLSDLFQGLSDIHLGNQKVTWKNLVLVFTCFAGFCFGDEIEVMFLQPLFFESTFFWIPKPSLGFNKKTCNAWVLNPPLFGFWLACLV